MSLIKTCLFLMFVSSAVDKVYAKCRQTYTVFCDDTSDLEVQAPEVLASWTTLVIGSENTSDSSQMHVIDQNTIPLDRMDKLTSLTLLNQVQDIQSSVFRYNHTKIEMITIYGGRLKRLKDESFDNFKLRKLRMVNTDLDYIHPGAFINCEIETMDLTGNKLELVENNVFSNGTIELILRHNSIEQIADGSLPESLEILNLDYNKIRVLNAFVFKNLVNLQELTLNYNRVSTIPDVSAMPYLRTIEASHNEILSMPMRYFNPLQQLEILDLSYNKIENPKLFDSLTLPGKSVPLQISLVFNRLTHMVLDIPVLAGHRILFYGNPWHCDCWWKMEKFMMEHKFKRHACDVKYFSNGRTPFCYNYSGNVTCQEPILKGPKLTKADFDVFLSSIHNNKALFHCDLTIRYL